MNELLINEKKIMYFKTPSFKEKSNVTFRRGSKWSSCFDTIEIRDLNENKIGETEIVQTLSLPFNEVHENGFLLNHDTSCTNREDIYKLMLECYPGFKETDIITLVFFNKVEE